MAARGPPPSLSIPSYPSGGSSDPFRSRGRNGSAGSSGPSSREHSVERRGDNRRGREVRGSGDFRASYNQQYQGAVFEANRRPSGQNWGYGREQRSNSKSKDFYWRDDSKGVHGRVQGVWEVDDSPTGSLSGSSTGSRGYSLTIGVDSQGRRSSSVAHQRPENSNGADRRQSNGYGGMTRLENGHAGSQRPGSSHGGYEGSGGYPRSSSRSGSYRNRIASLEPIRGASGSRVLQGRGLDTAKEVEPFGYGRELETFGSLRRVSRSTQSPGGFRPPAEEVTKPHWLKDNANAGDDRDVPSNTLKSLKKGDLRQSLANNSSSSPNGGKSSNLDSTNQTRRRRESVVGSRECREDAHKMDGHEVSQKQDRRGKSQSIPGGDHGQGIHFPLTKDEDGELLTPIPSITKWGAGYTRNSSFDSDLFGELVSPSSSSVSNKSLNGKNSYNRMKKRDLSDQLPVFSPSSEASKADIKPGSSIGRPSQENSSIVSLESSNKVSRENSFKLSRESSISESPAIDLGLDRNEGWNAATQQLHDKTPESASAGMHRTRSTDWYEICLREEEEEEMLARARKIEEESNLGNRTPSRFEGRNFSSTQKWGESAVFSPSSGTGGNHRETRNNLEKGWAQERLVRGDAADSAQPNLSSGKRNSDAGGNQTLFTPWNALDPVPASRNVPLGAPRSKSGHQHFENGPVEPRESVVKHEGLRVSIAGGRQEARGRRSGTVDPAEAANWRADRRTSRDHSREVVRPDVSREYMAGPSGRPISKQRSERESDQVSLVDTEKVVPEGLLKGVNGSIRPATFYRALHEAVLGNDEALPHIVGTCPDMCPGKERLQRERLRDLAVFERVSGDMRKTSKDLAVKKFCRTVVASELESTDVRPLPVLLRTQQYLLGLLDDPEFSFDIVHNFLFDRTRAIRQELGMQRILDHQTITIHEEIVRFHIVSEHELRDLNRTRSKQFDTHLNLQQLSKSLYSLLNLYISLGGNGGAHFENEAEFHAYYVLLNLGNHGRFQAEPLSLWFPNVPSHVLEGAPMQFARRVLRFYRSNNFIAFFRLVREATYLQACLLELNFDSVRAMALEMLNVAEYKLHPYPLSDLAQQMILEEKEVDELCMYYGLLTGTDKSSKKLCLLAKQGQFSTPEKGGLPQHSCPLIGDKRAPSLYQEVKALKVT